MFHRNVVITSKLLPTTRISSKMWGFKPGWTIRPEVIIEDTSEEDLKNAPDLSEFANRRKAQLKPLSIANMTLVEVSQKYSICLPFLADFVVTAGGAVPVNADIPIQDFMDNEQMLGMLSLVSSIDPSTPNLMYVDSVSVRKLCSQWGISYPEMIRLCIRCNVNLPFNLDTIPKSSSIRLMKKQLDSDRGFSTDTEEYKAKFAGGQYKPPPQERSESTLGSTDDENDEEAQDISIMDNEQIRDNFRVLFGKSNYGGDTSMFFDGPPTDDDIII